METLEPKLWSFLKLLYIDKRGMNLRNIVAHGLATGDAFNYVNAALVIQSVIFLSVIRDSIVDLVVSPEQEPSSERQETSNVRAS
jgi:lysyl-tRNA synthetase class 1